MWAFVLQTALAIAACVSLVFAYRWIRSRAPLAAFLFAVGLLARVAAGAGLALTWLGATSGGGALLADTRWFPDAQMYYEDARAAADLGLSQVSDSGPSPVFVRSLAVWMRLMGHSHAAAHVLNLVVYTAVALGACLVLTRRRDPVGARAAALVVGAFAGSPNLIILASQPLKDTLFFGALALVVIGLWWVLEEAPGAPLRLAPMPLALVLLGVYLISGMRAYFGLIILGVLAATLVTRGLLLLRAPAASRGLWRYAGATTVVLAVVWLGCRVGGGPYYDSLVDPVTRPLANRIRTTVNAAMRVLNGPEVAPSPTSGGTTGLIERLERSRRGFETSGGSTNMSPAELDKGGGTGVFQRVRGVMIGLGAVFVPVSLLKAAGLVQFTGGGRMLLLTDVDTVFLDLTLLACLVLVWRHRRETGGAWTLPAFLLLLGAISAMLVGYVVTNYGTLFRLRLLAVVPFWLLPIVLASPAAKADAAPVTVRTGVR